jgi:excisionase family DNA binding protein
VSARRREPAQLKLFPSGTLITSTRAAEIIDCSVDTIYRLLEAGQLEGYRLTVRGQWKIYFDSVVAYCQRIRETFALDDPNAAVPIHSRRPSL